jgi:hypothetical protein
MLRLVVVIRTPEGIQCCLFYSKQYSVVVMNCGHSEQVRFFFQLVHEFPDFWRIENGQWSLQDWAESNPFQHTFCRYVTPHLEREVATEARPHRRVDDVVFLKDVVEGVGEVTEGESFRQKKLKDMKLEKAANRNLFDLNLEELTKREDDGDGERKVLMECAQCGAPVPPCFRGEPCKIWQLLLISRLKCTMLVNGHLASCLINTIACSKRFRRHLFNNLIKLGGFCVPHAMPAHMANRWYERFCDYTTFDWMIDIVSVWPEQRIDYAW